jgi:hypothetical protein
MLLDCYCLVAWLRGRLVAWSLDGLVDNRNCRTEKTVGPLISCISEFLACSPPLFPLWMKGLESDSGPTAHTVYSASVQYSSSLPVVFYRYLYYRSETQLTVVYVVLHSGHACVQYLVHQDTQTMQCPMPRAPFKPRTQQHRRQNTLHQVTSCPHPFISIILYHGGGT